MTAGSTSLSVMGRAGVGALRFHLTGAKQPLTAWIAVTNRCDAMCTDCGYPMRAARELGTAALLGVVDGLADRGCQTVYFTGGEPLVRPDLPELVARAKARGLWVGIESNGYQYPTLAEVIGPFDRLLIPLEGPAEVHDQIREPGAYERVIAAVAAARAHGVPVTTVTTLNRHNLDSVDAVLEFAVANGVTAEFRLLFHNRVLDGGASREIAPEPEALRRTLRAILAARKAGRPVATSERTLRWMIDWDDFARPTRGGAEVEPNCMAGLTHLYVDPDGAVYPCRQRVGTTPGGNVATEGLDAAFDRCRTDACRACIATDLVERNLIDRLDGLAMLGAARNLIRRTRVRPQPG